VGFSSRVLKFDTKILVLSIEATQLNHTTFTGTVNFSMTNLLRTRLSRSVGNWDDFAMVCAGETVAEGSAAPRLGDELLRHLPADRRSNLASFPLAEAACKITGDRMDRLLQASAALDVGPDTFFLTAFTTLLARLAGQESVTLRKCGGDPASLSLTFNAEASFRTLLSASRNANEFDQPCAVEFAYASSRVSFADIADHGLRLTVHVTDGETLVCLASTTGLWDQGVLRLWLRYYDHLLAAAAAAPDIPWKTLPLLDAIDAQEFYLALNNTAAAYPADACVHELVMRWAEQTPDACAIASESLRITYRQLHERSDAIARQLQQRGAGPGRPVAVCMERTAGLPVALLAVLKAGSYYVPLVPHESPQRLQAILEECRPAALIVDRSFSAFSGDEIPLVYPDAVSESSVVLDYRAAGLTPDHPSYMIYTSGTTGKPKGVMIPHRALVNVLHAAMRDPGFTSFDRLLAVAPISFDIATMEMFLPLVAGGTLVVGDRFIAADPVRLAATIEKLDITVQQSTPITWRLLISSGWEGKQNLKVITGGEALPRDLANHLLRLVAELWNCYGPTETTIWSGALRIQAEDGVVPVGPPIANTAFYVLDETGRLLPPGVPGELYIGGIGVGAGYLDRPQLTTQRFLPDPFRALPGSRMFRSGDVVRLINGKEFEFFGRLDHQVKLRGYRIELGEIESVLRTFPGITDAVAALCESGRGEPYLVAYVTVSGPQPDLVQPDLRRIRDGLAQLLPSYMVPDRFVVMEAMPLTSHGKIDRKALPTPESVAVVLPAWHQPQGAAPQTELEEKLLTIFREVLNSNEFGVTDSFFDYGGYSLLTVNLFTRINRALHLSLPISLLFDAPTVRALAEIIDRDQSLSIIVPIRPRGTSEPLFVIHSYLLYGVLPKITEQDRPIYGVRELLGVAEPQTVVERAEAYVKEILRVCPDGPVALAGWCAAASLTIEIARQLRALDHPVGPVALFDAERPGYRPVIRGYWYFRLIASLKLHFRRLSGEYRRKKLVYFRTVLRRFCDSIVESLFMHNRTLVLRLQRLFGFPLPDTVFNNTWARVAAIQNYAPARYPGKVWLFRALDVPQFPGTDETLGWKDIVDGGVEVVFVNGDHESMFRDPHVDFLSRRLRQALQLGA
jgi:amino acid adenylation domain-containing protein